MPRHFIWDSLEDNITEEFDDGGNVTAEYMTEPVRYGNVVGQNRADSGVRYYASDPLGSIVAAIDAFGVVTDTRRYDAFGNAWQATGTTTLPYAFVGSRGYRTDSSMRRLYVRRRTYDTNTARWLSADSLFQSSTGLEPSSSEWSIPKNYTSGFSERINLYSYAQRRPLTHVDPSGEKVYWCTRDLDGWAVGNHSFIVVIPDDPDAFANDPNMIDLYEKNKGCTLAGHKDETTKCLIYVRNQKGDRACMREYFDKKRYLKKGNPDFYKSGWSVECNLIETPDGMTDTEFIKKLIELAEWFKRNNKKLKILYDLNDENCNCWANSVFKYAGVPEKVRIKGGEFGGIDWGEEEILDPDVFEEPETQPTR